MTTLRTARKNEVTEEQKIAMLSYLKEVHENSEVKIVWGYKRYNIILDGEYCGQLVICTGCGEVFDELGEGNYVYDLIICDSCQSIIDDVITR